jgi:hypothetical protein
MALSLMPFDLEMCMVQQAQDFDEACRRNGECYRHLTSTQHEAGEAMTKAAEVMGDRIARNVAHANSLARRVRLS